MEWQFSYFRFFYWWPWHHRTYDEDFDIYFHTAGFAFWQFCWWGE